MPISKINKNNKSKTPKTKKSESSENVIDFIPRSDQLEGLGGGLFGTHGSSTPLSKAQDIMYDAWECNDSKQRIVLAQEALQTSPLCADAYSLLAEELAQDLGEALAYYQKAVKAGEESLGPVGFKEYAGHFWGFLETRPYMRARAGLGETLWVMGAHKEAILNFEEMLELNPNDNQGIRYSLTAKQLEAEHFDDLKALLDQFPKDTSAHFQYTRALLAYKEKSNDMPVIAADAWESNKHVPAMLAGRAPLMEPGDYITMGGEDEAHNYVSMFGAAWKRTPFAIDWLLSIASEVAANAGEVLHLRQKVGRNAPCPCGSGKKYKQCCLNTVLH